MSSELRKYRFQALGTTCSLQLHDVDDPDALACAVADLVREREARWSRFRPDSLISRVNAAAGSPERFALDPLDERIFDVCRLAHARSHGLIEPLCGGWSSLEHDNGQLRLRRADTSLDLGGLGKEFLVDLAGETLMEAGAKSFLIDFGGDVLARGAPPGKNGWDIALFDPLQPEPRRPWRQIRVAAAAVCTSGNAARRRHILDPRSGQPSTSPVLQATVLAAQALEAGFLSTLCCIVDPTEGLRLLAEVGAEGLLCTSTQLHLSPRAEELFAARTSNENDHPHAARP